MTPSPTATDDEAFADLVRSHQTMVRATCARLLGPRHPDLDDACQATFIILQRRLPGLRQTTLPAWLHRVACSVCHHIRRDERRRARRIQHAAPPPVVDAPPEDDRLRLLDAAIEGLSAPQRDAVVRYFLHGQPQSMVAADLGISEGALKKRVADGIASLRRFFARRDLQISSASLLAMLVADGTGDALSATEISSPLSSLGSHPHALSSITARATHLAHGWLRTMLIKKISISTVSIALVGTLGGLLAFSGHAPAAEHASGPMPAPPAVPLADAPSSSVVNDDRQLAATFRQVIDDLRHNDLRAIYTAMPVDVRKAVRLQILESRGQPDPVADASFDTTIAMFKMDHAADILAPMLANLLTAQHGKLMSNQSTGLSGQVVDAIADDLTRWLAAQDYSDTAKARRAVGCAVEAVHRFGIDTSAQFRALSPDQIIDRGGQVLASLKQALAVYGLDIDAMLSSAVLADVAEHNGTYSATVRFTAFGVHQVVHLTTTPLDFWGTCVIDVNPLIAMHAATVGPATIPALPKAN